jgi:MFS family permease
MDVRHLEGESASTSGGDALATLTTRQQLVMNVLWFAQNFQSAALLPIVIPVQIALWITPGQIGTAPQATALGWISTIGAFIALFAPPIVGALSDRTTGPWGRRRPWIALGVALLLVGTWLLAIPNGLVALIVGLLIFQLGGNTATAGYQGLMPDLVPQEQRGASSGYLGIMTILGNAGGLALAAYLLGDVGATTPHDTITRSLFLFYMLTGVILAIGAGITLLGVHERPLAPGLLPKPSARLKDRLAGWLTPWRMSGFRWVFLTRSSVMMGLSLFMTFIAYYFANVAHISNFVEATAVLAILALVGAAGSALTLGLASDRVGRVPLVCGATVCMATAAASFVILPQGTPLWPLGLLFGVGYGAYTSVDWALAVDVLPSPEAAGRDMGVWSIATSAPAILAPLVGGLAISVADTLGDTTTGYRVVFGLAVAFLLAGAFFILRVRDQFARSPSTHAERKHPGFGWRLARRSGGGKARGFLRFWPVWERIWLAFFPTRSIPSAPHDLLHVRFKTYHGKPITLPDGVEIRRGSRLCELHFNNAAISQLAAETTTWELMRMLREDFAALARWSRQPDFPSDVQALFGYTLLNEPAPRLGFTVRERPHTLITWLDRLFMTGLLALYNPRGRARLEEGATYGSYPAELWMPVGELQRRFDSATPDAGTATTS